MRRALLLAVPLAAMSIVACAKRAPMTASTYEPMAVAELHDAQGNSMGLVTFSATRDGASATASLHGLEPYSQHGLHVHSGNACTGPDFRDARGHFAPDDDAHGAPAVPERSHAGDLGNITANRQGIAIKTVARPDLALMDPEYTVLDHAVVLHAERDDAITQPSGASGDRIACGVVQLDSDLSPEDFKMAVR